MSTTTLTPGVATIAAPAAQMDSLHRAFWIKTKRMGASAFTSGVSFLKSIGAKVLSVVPAPAITLAAAVPLVTRVGYDTALTGAYYTGRSAGWLTRTIASIGHRMLHWGGERVADLVSVFSETGAEKVRAANARFGEARVAAYRRVAGSITEAGWRVLEAADAPFTRTTVGLTAGVVAGSVIASHLVPSMFTTVVGALPRAAGMGLAGLAMGGLSALSPIGLVGGAAVLAVLLARLVRGSAEPAEEVEDHPVPTDAEGRIVDGQVVTRDGKVTVEPDVQVVPDGTVLGTAVVVDGGITVYPTEAPASQAEAPVVVEPVVFEEVSPEAPADVTVEETAPVVTLTDTPEAVDEALAAEQRQAEAEFRAPIGAKVRKRASYPAPKAKSKAKAKARG